MRLPGRRVDGGVAAGGLRRRRPDFDPLSVEGIAEAIETALANPRPLVEKGLARAAEFTWDETARQHEGVYRDVI